MFRARDDIIYAKFVYESNILASTLINQFYNISGTSTVEKKKSENILLSLWKFLYYLFIYYVVHCYSMTLFPFDPVARAFLSTRFIHIRMPFPRKKTRIDNGNLAYNCCRLVLWFSVHRLRSEQKSNAMLRVCEWDKVFKSHLFFV